jgi:ribonuclease BN (tRNA processing enzyme)
VLEIQDKLDLETAFVFSKKTVHTADSIAYRFEERGRSIVFTGDCDYDQGLIDLSQEADLLVMDCSFPNALKVSGHLTPAECGSIAKQAQAKKLILSHIYPGENTASILLNECKSVFDGEVVVAEDLMEFDIP